MASEDCHGWHSVETLMAEWDVLYSLLRGQSERPFPSDEKIKSSISKTETDLRRCNEEIECLQVQIIALENEKRLIERNAVGYTSLLAPIRKLPSELLQQIFLFVCDDNFISDCFRIPPATLVQVCSSWKNLASSAHRLWSIITLVVSDRFSPDAWVALELLLEKSGSVPLDLNITINHMATFSASSSLDMLVRQSRRWSRLELCLDYQLFDDVCRVLRPIQGNLPLLEHLEFNAGRQSLSGRVLDVFQDASRLRSVKLSHESSPDVIILPWQQLQSLVLWEASYQYIPLQRLSSRLNSITIDGYFDDPGNDEPCVDMVLDAEALLLGLETSDDAYIIDNLTLPKLTSLTMFSRNTSGSFVLDEISPLQSLISRSSCTLTSLTWSNLPTPLEPFLSFLSTATSLRSLSLSDESVGVPLIGTGLFDKLQNHFSFSSIFLPNLQTLSLSSTKELGFSDACFVDVVTSRWFPNGGVVQCLRSVRLETPNRRFTANTIPLQQLIRAGMKIVIKDQAGVVLC